MKRNSQLPPEMEGKKWPEIDADDVDKFNLRMKQVKNWLELYAPHFVKFEVQKQIPTVNLSETQKEFLLKVADVLEKTDYYPEELHDKMYPILNDLGLKPQKAFQAIYKVIIGKKQGPRAASFVLSLDKDFVIERFRMRTLKRIGRAEYGKNKKMNKLK